MSRNTGSVVPRWSLRKEAREGGQWVLRLAGYPMLYLTGAQRTEVATLFEQTTPQTADRPRKGAKRP